MEMNDNIIKNVCCAFIKDAKVEEIEVIPNGHINSTYRVKVSGRDYILQRVNTNIFRDPAGLINNIASVTEFLRKKIIEASGDPDRETLTLVKTQDGKYTYEDESGLYRMYLFITDATCYNKAEKNSNLFVVSWINNGLR